MPEPLVMVMAAFGFLSAVLVIAALVAFRRRRWMGTLAALIVGTLFFALAGLAGTIGLATKGYRALTREEVAAQVVTQPTGPQKFTATFTFPDGRQMTYPLTGNALYVDAHIVKWHPLANYLGLHTAYQLDRVAGRYDRLEDERVRPRSAFSLSSPNPVSIVQVARTFGPLIDAEYGSATFVSTRGPAALELRVSTSGLLFRTVKFPRR
jgi:hypothetical protein